MEVQAALPAIRSKNKNSLPGETGDAADTATDSWRSIESMSTTSFLIQHQNVCIAGSCNTGNFMPI